MTTKSAPSAIDPGTPVKGRRFTYRSRENRNRSRRPRSRVPGRHRRVPHGRPDGPEQNGVVAPQLFERLVGQDRPVPQIAGGPQVEIRGLQLDTGRRHHLQRLGADLGPDAVAPDDRHPPVLRAFAH